jgi:phenylalanyl-tRNA synthetase alpha chain
MESITNRITKLKEELTTALQKALTDEHLEHVRVTFIGRNGHIAAIMNELKTLSLEEKRVFGPQLNELKEYAETSIKNKKEVLAQELLKRAAAKTQNFDVTISKKTELNGNLHLYTKIFNRIEDIFTSMGYAVTDGPEIESEYYNFDALNIPADHPARDMFDTIWISDIPNTLLRTHTSPMQVRTMENKGVPLAVIAPGRCYRLDAVDATHDFMFTQIEALVIGKNITIANLLATAQAFGQAFFEKKDLNIRVRPSYFPFVEPGVEVDFSCPFCSDGCAICKKTCWIEIGGAGLVHPHVLRCGGIDPEIYSGFAFGFGIERLAMLKYRIPDIRLFHSTKIAVLNQF